MAEIGVGPVQDLTNGLTSTVTNALSPIVDPLLSGTGTTGTGTGGTSVLQPVVNAVNSLTGSLGR